MNETHIIDSRTQIVNRSYSWIPILFYLSNLYRMVFNSSLFYSTIFVIGGIIGIYILLIKRPENWKLIACFFLLYAVSCIMNSFIIGNQSLNGALSSILIFGIGLLLLYSPISYFQGWICFYLIAFFFIIAIILGIPNYSIFVNSSENYISVHLILGISVYYLGLFHSGRKLMLFDLFPPLLCFFLSIWGNGRGGILSSTLLFIFIVFSFIHQHRDKGVALFVIRFFVVASVLILVLKWDAIMSSFLGLGNMDKGMESAREFIWLAYFEEIQNSTWYLLNGVPLENIPIISDYNNNTHNSFIQFHANNGLLVFVIFLFLYLRSSIYYIRNNVLFFAVAFTILFRGMTDKFIFGEYGMPLFVFLSFYPMVLKR